VVREQALKARLEIRFGAPFAEHIFSRLQRSSALKSIPGVPLRSTPGFNPVAPSALKSTASLRSFRLPFPLAESQLGGDVCHRNKGHQD
jgi:hypothetical protein